MRIHRFLADVRAGEQNRERGVAVQILRTCLYAFDVHFQCFSSGGVELSNVFADGFLCGQLLELACGSIEIGDDV